MSKQVYPECRRQYDLFNRVKEKPLGLDACRKLFNCNKHKANCYQCDYFGHRLEDRENKL